MASGIIQSFDALQVVTRRVRSLALCSCHKKAETPLQHCYLIYTTLTMGKTQYVFVRDPEYAWVPAIKLDATGTKATVKVPQYANEQAIWCDGGNKAKGWEEDEVMLKDYNKGVLPMQNVDASGQLKSFADMVNLPFLHEVRLTCIECPALLASMSSCSNLRFFLDPHCILSTPLGWYIVQS